MPEPIIIVALLFYFLFSLGWITRGCWDNACYLAEQKRTAQTFREMKIVGIHGIPITRILTVPVHPIKYAP